MLFSLSMPYKSNLITGQLTSRLLSTCDAVTDRGVDCEHGSMNYTESPKGGTVGTGSTWHHTQ